MTTAVEIERECEGLEEYAVARHHGRLPSRPVVAVFSRATVGERLFMRLDDQLGRAAQGDEDDLLDLMADLVELVAHARVSAAGCSVVGQVDLAAVCLELATFLLAKNAAYGDSALAPVRVFSRADPVEQLRVRLDDKLSRLARGHEHGADDTVLDLLGYLVLLRIAQRRARCPVPEVPPDRSCLLTGGGARAAA